MRGRHNDGRLPFATEPIMVVVETDASGDWNSRTEWGELAERAVFAAIASSRHRALNNSELSAEVSVRFTDDEEVRALNAGYRNKEKTTNVLSFPMIEPELLESIIQADGGDVLLGDIALAHGVCAGEAADKGVSVENHAAHLVVHGALHLLGYDHQHDDEAEEMEQVEREALAAIGIPDPYAMTEVQS
jgi:probable rRNA maturation factor